MAEEMLAEGADIGDPGDLANACWEKPKEIEGDTLEEFENLCDNFFQVKGRKDALKAELKIVNDELKELEGLVLATMQQHKKIRHAARMGSFSITEKQYPRMPSDPFKKKSFFNYLKEKGDFDSLITVNTMSLRGYFNSAKEAAKLPDGSDNPAFSMPGIETYDETKLNSTSKKG